LDEVRSTWETFGRTIPMRSIMWRQQPWELDEFFETGRANVRDAMASLLRMGLTPSGRALDFGCGIGRLTRALAERFDEVVGVDVASSMVELANKHNPYPERCRFVVNSTDDLRQFESESFDFVFSLIVLQHVGTDIARRYVAEFMRVLRPHGVAMFQVPSDLVEIPVLAAEAMHAQLAVLEPAPAGGLRAEAGSSMSFTVRVANISDRRWDTSHRVHLGGTWLRAHGRTPVDDQGPRAPLETLVEAGSSTELVVDAAVPVVPGSYVLSLDLHHARGAFSTGVEIPVEVDAAGGLVADAPDPRCPNPDGVPTAIMEGVPRAEVLEILRAHGGEVVAAEANDMAGPEWHSYTYVVRKGAPAGWTRLRNRVRSLRARAIG
jgi:SAM-dependent methyltransferase